MQPIFGIGTCDPKALHRVRKPLRRPDGSRRVEKFQTATESLDEGVGVLLALKGNQDDFFTAEMKAEIFVNLASNTFVRQPGFGVVVGRNRLCKGSQHSQRHKHRDDDGSAVTRIEILNHGRGTRVGESAVAGEPNPSAAKAVIQYSSIRLPATFQLVGGEDTRQSMCPRFCKRERLRLLQPFLAQFCIKVVPLFHRTGAFRSTSSNAGEAATAAGRSFGPSLFGTARIIRTIVRRTP